MLEHLDEAECLRLIAPGGVGRIAYSGRYGPTVLPVNYRLSKGTIVFRTAQHSATDEDLRTGIAHAEYTAAREGWSVLIQGSAHHVESEAEHASVAKAGVDPWPDGDRQLFLRVTPSPAPGAGRGDHASAQRGCHHTGPELAESALVTGRSAQPRQGSARAPQPGC